MAGEATPLDALVAEMLGDISNSQFKTLGFNW